MESALYGIFTLVGFVSEISLVRCAHSFDFRYFTNSSENPVRTRFPWSNLYISNKGEWNNCFSKFSNRVLPPIFISTILQSVWKEQLAHNFPYDVKLRLLAHSRSFIANQNARNAIVGAENLHKWVILTIPSPVVGRNLACEESPSDGGKKFVERSEPLSMNWSLFAG